jgi:hypothetical protein
LIEGLDVLEGTRDFRNGEEIKRARPDDLIVTT